jgi:hypothetical protein
MRWSLDIFKKTCVAKSLKNQNKKVMLVCIWYYYSFLWLHFKKNIKLIKVTNCIFLIQDLKIKLYVKLMENCVLY